MSETKTPTESLSPGEARCPGPSTSDIILQDAQKPPAAITTESYTFLGDDDIAYARYTSRGFFDREVDKMWTRTWQFACREEHIPDVGDTYVYDVNRHSVVVVRHAKDQIKAFINSCKHRGMQLRPSASRGTLKQIRCPFHGFCWHLDGTLKSIPCDWDFPHIDQSEFGLDEVRVDRWGGFIFINLDNDAAPLEAYLEVIPDHFRHWGFENRHVALHIEKLLPANWKLAQEAFLEAYHVLATHPQGLLTAGDANAQYDVFGDNVSRFVHTIGFPSPHLDRDMSEDDILTALGGKEAGLTLKEGQRAREVYADHLRNALGQDLKIDLSNLSTSEMIDSIEYFCFPNFFVFPGISLPMVYRFRPNGDDVDSCIFDLMFLRPLPDGEKAPMAPAPIKLDVDQSFTTAEGMDNGLAVIYDQDTQNLLMQTRGIKASRKQGQTLGNYQEVRLRRMHMTLDQYLSD